MGKTKVPTADDAASGGVDAEASKRLWAEAFPGQAYKAVPDGVVQAFDYFKEAFIVPSPNPRADDLARVETGKVVVRAQRPPAQHF